MFRLRRYRIFIVFAIIAVGLLYHFASISDLESAGAGIITRPAQSGTKSDVKSSSLAPESDSEDGSAEGKEGTANTPPTRIGSGHHGAPPEPEEKTTATDSEVVQATSTKLQKSSDQTASASAAEPTAEDANPKGHPKAELQTSSAHGNATAPAKGPADPVIDPKGGGARLEVIGATGKPKIHWTPLPEHFPIPTESLIALPTSEPKSIPAIQHRFKTESSTEKSARQEKLDLIRKTFSFSWAGYRTNAWLQDELSPQSGRYRNPFCGWGATLVDALDTLWILGLKEEFEEAVDAVGEIDFTTSMRNDIPLFETVIRYLGGLIGAYDISGGAHKILLDKAVELAEILMGAFDTPNRMPLTFYLWKPTFATQPHRAKTRVVLAELGSMSLEFTRLAQITKEDKYYDAIARITNELELMQSKTKIPGLWPQMVDASGCRKPDRSTTSTFESALNHQNEKPLSIAENGAVIQTPSSNTEEGTEVEKTELPTETAEQEVSSKAANAADGSTSATVAAGSEAGASKSASSGNIPRGLSKRDAPQHVVSTPPKQPDCEPQGLASPPHAGNEAFSIGGQADSTYEYLPKEYMLLGGLEGKYQTMYESAADAVIDTLIFRSMIPDEERNIFGSGLILTHNSENPRAASNFHGEGTHLTCFAGGMFAVGAKIFEREGDLDRAKKLTDGCVWAYETTDTGIMPELFHTIPCKSLTECPWNETIWNEELDPYADSREQQRVAQKERQQQRKLELQKQKEAAAAKSSVVDASDLGEATSVKANHTNTDLDDLSTVDRSATGLTDSAKDSTQAGLREPADDKPTAAADSRTSLRKRQLGDLDDSPALKPSIAAGNIAGPASETGIREVASKPSEEKTSEITESLPESSESPDSLVAGEPTSTTTNPMLELAQEIEETPILTSAEFVAERIKNERLPKGMKSIGERKYILRPEAIESVFIMYRVTGDDYWREKGWKMFQAVEKHTKTTYGASAITDVTATAEDVSVMDEMESFWLAETLKYYYLLFSEPELVSLDDYVLNTEAHPFKRPKA